MIEIAKKLLIIIANVINAIFNVQIELSNATRVPLGFLLIGVAFFTIAIAFVCNILNIGGGE